MNARLFRIPFLCLGLTLMTIQSGLAQTCPRDDLTSEMEKKAYDALAKINKPHGGMVFFIADKNGKFDATPHFQAFTQQEVTDQNKGLQRVRPDLLRAIQAGSSVRIYHNEEQGTYLTRLNAEEIKGAGKSKSTGKLPLAETACLEAAKADRALPAAKPNQLGCAALNLSSLPQITILHREAGKACDALVDASIGKNISYFTKNQATILNSFGNAVGSKFTTNLLNKKDDPTPTGSASTKTKSGGSRSTRGD